MRLFRDRRRLPRTETAIRVEVLDRGGWMIAHDVSLGGMLVTTRAPRWPGELVRVRFHLPGLAHAVRATCRVVNLVEVPHGVGLALRFLKLHPRAQLAIHAYVDGRPPPSFADELVSSRIVAWVQRIVDDCAQLGALARP